MTEDKWNPEQYLKFKQERAQPFFDLLELVDTQAPLEQVVDLGCGTGELTRVLHEKSRARSTLGIDRSPRMLAKAHELLRTNQIPGLSFQQGDIESFDEKAKFDLVFSNAALHWCDHHPALFTVLRESLKPGAQLAVQMPMNHDHATHLLAQEMAKELGLELTVPLLPPQEYCQLLYRLGFMEQKVLLRIYGQALHSRDQVLEWVKGSLLTWFESRLSPEGYERFLEEYRARLLSRLPDDRPFFYLFKRVLIWGRL